MYVPANPYVTISFDRTNLGGYAAYGRSFQYNKSLTFDPNYIHSTACNKCHNSCQNCVCFRGRRKLYNCSKNSPYYYPYPNIYHGPYDKYNLTWAERPNYGYYDGYPYIRVAPYIS